jgi:hypothetical protein
MRHTDGDSFGYANLSQWVTSATVEPYDLVCDSIMFTEAILFLFPSLSFSQATAHSLGGRWLVPKSERGADQEQVASEKKEKEKAEKALQNARAEFLRSLNRRKRDAARREKAAARKREEQRRALLSKRHTFISSIGERREDAESREAAAIVRVEEETTARRELVRSKRAAWLGGAGKVEQEAFIVLRFPGCGSPSANASESTEGTSEWRAETTEEKTTNFEYITSISDHSCKSGSSVSGQAEPVEGAAVAPLFSDPVAGWTWEELRGGGWHSLV